MSTLMIAGMVWGYVSLAGERVLAEDVESSIGKLVFDPMQAFEVMDIEHFSDHPSSAIDSGICVGWQLGMEEWIWILKTMQPITATDWHYRYSHLPCISRGVVVQAEARFEVEINAGAWLMIVSDTILYYGDSDRQLTDVFVDEVWRPEEGE
ncbi:hypothetical protein BFP72_06795 [Reichenbachiella sp. 5M10]|uniref:hypothetical protein n=1 Tax=Reichenbachiella sp. 5M10 TaxID=1889772 RepID=UPI000C15A25C|nr:hypothetical protein [Reichenbachiella sp. 5M10]PIB35122.1 hypothetical protein BFP72_06795 [Reichenbachiella sp. 5M10]